MAEGNSDNVLGIAQFVVFRYAVFQLSKEQFQAHIYHSSGKVPDFPTLKCSFESRLFW